jgi:hypothetical protein
MSELKRNADFHVNPATKPATVAAHGIDESQPWRAAEMQRAMEVWIGNPEAGGDPYNHVGARARKNRAA